MYSEAMKSWIKDGNVIKCCDVSERHNVLDALREWGFEIGFHEDEWMDSRDVLFVSRGYMNPDQIHIGRDPVRPDGIVNEAFTFEKEWELPELSTLFDFA